ncbi:glycoside hydrolase family 99-like domain-containing protein [Hoylesella buccalis]|uniref:glycosyltransferase WbsX family protein n=1 Tax=Hoylesella buccalis TaxID=28127 RepID=UPI001D13848F|nr:glycoside hydrolase family 99-like domain-containing protein [Hoylesella buccalis]UEA63275.1 glycoside hydrolase family 99-like domain-containing protein [Hoylesella buccalis]UWP49434.1 glycoside hydrolase family 99-like domain-containing protein [Hoylesella buccalis ATCC 35310]
MKARVIAYYLPQFHPIPENDKYWGKGFTEWTNVAKAKPLFKGHYQPRIPADLGFYDLRLPEVREQQAQMAREAGIEGFCYWHYWFGNGKRLLQRPFNEVLQSGKPDFPFCLAWANHSWKTSTWENGGKDRMIVEQRYLGEEDYTLHFQEVLPAFRDKRYITIEGKPLFAIFDPYNFRDVSNFIKTWQRLAKENGLKGIYFIAMSNSTSTLQRNADGTLKRVAPNLQSSERVYKDLLNLGFDGINSFGKSRAEMLYMGKYARIAKKLLHQYLPFLPTHRINYEKITQHFFAPEDSWQNVYPSIFPQWDRTPRAGNSEGVYVNATPTTFKKHVEDALNVIENKDMEHRILFLRAWNEWGEGNYVEPDLKYGHGFLDAIKETIV